MKRSMKNFWLMLIVISVAGAGLYKLSINVFGVLTTYQAMFVIACVSMGIILHQENKKQRNGY
jgi:hypothetical protein